MYTHNAIKGIKLHLLHHIKINTQYKYTEPLHLVLQTPTYIRYHTIGLCLVRALATTETILNYPKGNRFKLEKLIDSIKIETTKNG